MNMIIKTKLGQGVLVLTLMLVSGIITSSAIHPVLADVATIENVEPWISGADTILNITIRHASPTSIHYVDRIEVDVNGSVEFTTLFPQSTETFVVPYNIGPVTGTPSVSVRALCTIHAPSDWSEPLIIPELSVILFLLAFVLLPIIAHLSKRSRKKALV
jgi:hypothetical protein